jgi:hypothetical protein
MDICLHPALLADGEMLLVMGYRALDLTFDDQVLIGRQFAFKYQCWPDNGYVLGPYRPRLPNS